MPIEMRDFSAGWIASDDDYNGRKNGFLQMDNCCLDENGNLTLVRGTAKLTTDQLPDIPHTLFSRYIGTDFYRYAALEDGSVWRDKNRAGTWSLQVASGGSTSRADFTVALNRIFSVTGNQYFKDTGAAQVPIGVAAPTSPTVAQYNAFSFVDLQNLDGSSQFTNWTCDVGTLNWNNAHGDINFTADATSFLAVIRTVFSSPVDLTTYPSGGPWPVAGQQLPTDFIQFWTSFFDATQCQSVTINLYTYDPGAVAANTLSPGTYYTHTWNQTDNPLPFAGNNFNHLKVPIQDFIQLGGTTVNGWNAIKAVTISYVCSSATTIQVAEVQEYGSTRASQNGTYRYYTQNISNNGDYQAVSIISAPATPLLCLYGALELTLTPPVDAQTTHVNIYRQEINNQSVATLLATVTAATTSYLDGLSDQQLLSNSGISANLFFTSIQSIPDAPILAIIGLYYARMLYFTSSKIYISDFLDPDIYDARYVIQYSGNVAESFMWAMKVSNACLYVGTNYDIYQITGTFSILPDGTLDVTIRPLGVQYPPVSQAVACESGIISYMANDGWRLLGVYGDDSTTISQDLNLLFKGYLRYGILPIQTGYDNTILSRCSINKGKLYTVVTLSDASTVIIAYDIVKKYWYPIKNVQASCLFSEEDGTLIYGDDGGFVYQLDTPLNYSKNGSQQSISILTPVLDGGTPQQRKDTFTLKVRCATAGDNINLLVYGNGGTLLHTFTLNAASIQELIFDGLSLTLQDNYQFAIQGSADYFELNYIILDYTERPIPTTRLRLAPQNMGSSGKKRMFTCPPFVIDTLGNSVTFTPELDNSTTQAVTNPTINTTEKTTIVPTFATEVLATDVGGILTGGPFEFYGIFVDDWIVEKIPTGRLVDQIGPYEALRWAFLERFRYRCICEGTTINYVVYVEDVVSYTGSFNTIANVDKTYEIVLPKGLNGTTFRIVFTSSSLIHKYSAKVKLRITGGSTEGKWV